MHRLNRLVIGWSTRVTFDRSTQLTTSISWLSRLQQLLLCATDCIHPQQLYKLGERRSLPKMEEECHSPSFPHNLTTGPSKNLRNSHGSSTALQTHLFRTLIRPTCRTERRHFIIAYSQWSVWELMLSRLFLQGLVCHGFDSVLCSLLRYLARRIIFKK